MAVKARGVAQKLQHQYFYGGVVMAIFYPTNHDDGKNKKKERKEASEIDGIDYH
ncbi:MAG TPA: hypothetical protein VFZ67_09250 [Nitrososphaera sp.]